MEEAEAKSKILYNRCLSQHSEFWPSLILGKVNLNCDPWSFAESRQKRGWARTQRQLKLHAKLFIWGQSFVLFGNVLVVSGGDIQAIFLVNYVYFEFPE